MSIGACMYRLWKRGADRGSQILQFTYKMNR
jgi:hypothetical protein